MKLDLICGSATFLKEKEAVKNGLGSHAYIIEGRLGQGKTAFALASACLRFCTGEDKPCLKCPACRKVQEGIHPDIHFIEPEKGVIKVDQIREMISTLYESPYEGGAKIYVLRQFHLANEYAQNALLKTLEEPPRSVTFFLLSENSNAVLPTVRSRCKLLRLTDFAPKAVEQFLEEQFPQNPRNGYAAENCGGNIGSAVKLVTDEEYIRLDEIARDITQSLEGDPSAVQIGLMLEKEREQLDTLLDILLERLFRIFGENQRSEDLLRIKAVQDAISAKKKNINSGLVCDSLAYLLAKGGKTWQR